MNKLASLLDKTKSTLKLVHLMDLKGNRIEKISRCENRNKNKILVELQKISLTLHLTSVPEPDIFSAGIQ